MLKWIITYTYLSKKKIIIITYKDLLDPDCLFGIHSQQGSSANWHIWLMWIFFGTLTRDYVSFQTEANSIRMLITSILVHDIFLSFIIQLYLSKTIFTVKSSITTSFLFDPTHILVGFPPVLVAFLLHEWSEVNTGQLYMVLYLG